MRTLYLSYINLSPGLTNPFTKDSHSILLEVLRKNFGNWDGFNLKYPEFSLGLIIVTKRGIDELEVKGPSISKKHQVVDFSIFLPENIADSKEYLEFIFDGLQLIFNKYGIDEQEIMKIKYGTRDLMELRRR